MKRSEYNRRMAKAMPHGPNEPCTCDGTTVDGGPCVCTGHVLGCTCDIAWDEAAELRDVWIEEDLPPHKERSQP